MLFQSGGKPLLNQFGLFKKGTLFPNKPKDDMAVPDTADQQPPEVNQGPPVSGKLFTNADIESDNEDIPPTHPDVETPKPEHSGNNKWLDVGMALLGGLGDVLTTRNLTPEQAANYNLQKQNQIASTENHKILRQIEQARAAQTADFQNKKLGLDKRGQDETERFHRAIEGRPTKASQDSVARDETLEQQHAFETLSPDEVKDISSSSPDDLVRLLAHPDPDIRKAANYVYNLKSKARQLESPNN